MDKSRRQYYKKSLKRMYGGSDSEEEERRKRNEGGFVELQPEVVEFNRLHKREEALYFYDAFAYPWDKDKHYKMVYQLEKKYFPEHSLDKAFVEPGDKSSGGGGGDGGGSNKGSASASAKGKVKSRASRGKEEMSDRKLVFFDEEKEKKVDGDLVRDEKRKDVMAKKVEFFKCLRKVPDENSVSDGESYVLTRSTELPPRWDGPFGTVVLIKKPEGGTASSRTFRLVGLHSQFVEASKACQSKKGWACRDSGSYGNRTINYLC